MAAAKKAERAEVITRLEDMGLDQIANWVRILPEESWERLFWSSWPVLAKKCGL
ncbi:hypothetical protein AB6A23_06995 [Paenibacillus tarimensis]